MPVRPRSALALRAGRLAAGEFAEFVVGSLHRVAYASASASSRSRASRPTRSSCTVPSAPQDASVGAVYVGLRKNWPDAKICFVTAEEFANRFLQRCAEPDLGVPQAVPLLRGAPARRPALFGHEEGVARGFLHTFDALMARAEVVGTTDCHPPGRRLPAGTDRPDSWVGPSGADAARRRRRGWRSSRRSAQRARRHPARGAEVPGGEPAPATSRAGRGGAEPAALRRVTGRAIDLALAREALGDLLRHAVGGWCD